MKRYFDNASTLEELRSQYKKLLKQYHPNNKNGSEEATKAISVEYEALFKRLKDVHDARQTDTSDGKESAYNVHMYDWENDVALREVLQKIINFSGIEIEIIGQWIWVFNAYSCHKELNAMGFKYAGKKKAWYFHTETFRKKSHKVISLDDSRKYYGSSKVHTADKKDLIEA